MSAPEFTLAQVAAFLDGTAPLDGLWFGEENAEGAPYWWRKHLAAAIRTQPTVAGGELPDRDIADNADYIEYWAEHLTKCGLRVAGTTLSAIAADYRTHTAAALREQGGDAERYRWLREHFRFANDSLHEIWFDSSLAPGADWLAPQLDKEIDAATQHPAAVVGGSDG